MTVNPSAAASADVEIKTRKRNRTGADSNKPRGRLGYPTGAVKHALALLLLAPSLAPSLWAAAVPVDLSEYRPGPVSVEHAGETLTVRWRDEADKPWQAVFSLDPSKPLIASIAADGKPIVTAASPFYQVETGKRQRGWNGFFEHPPAHPDGTKHAAGKLNLQSARVRTVADRVELSFDGLHMGDFTGAVAYTVFPGSRLLLQEAVARTYVPNTAYYYDAGLGFRSLADRRPGANMGTAVSFYDQQGEFQTQLEESFHPERTPEKVRYRTLALKTEHGAIAAFPPPHQYFFPRDFTSNLGYLWHRSFRGEVGLGIRQIRDANWKFYPWMNAPPGTEQRMAVFFQLSDGSAQATLDDVLALTRRDRFQPLPGYKTVSSHWHLAYTVQAMEYGFDWTPPFQPVLQEMGVDASIIMDFHGDGHPRDLTDLRLKELDAYFEALRAQSDEDFLLIPSEEANVHYGGHWALVFPKPVYWFMNRPEGGAFETDHPKYGKVYSVANEEELLELIRKEDGLAYQTHARTKGSTGYPDRIQDKPYFRDPSYFGAGWKSLPVDPSSPRLGDRIFNLLDDLHQDGIEKKILGEVDLFQLDSTHELYAHMNVNYVRADRLPSFENYGEILQPIREGRFFVTTGEVLAPEVAVSTADPNQITIDAELQWTYPLERAEIVWGDGENVFTETIPLTETRAHGKGSFQWKVPAKGWKWARVAVWDVATNGAFVNPVRR